MKTQINKHRIRMLVISLLVITTLLSACQPAGAVTDQPSAQPAEVTQTEAPTTEPTAAEATPALTSTGEITLNLDGVAEAQFNEQVAPVSLNPEQPWWDALPEHHRVTLQGYPVTEHLLQPQIFVYPVADLAEFNETAGQMATGLQALLQSQQPGETLPFMPLYNAAQVMHAQVQFLDFQNGRGVRFITQFDQAPLPINSYELIYTFQGLTSDGKFYVAAVLPIAHPELPATQQVDPQQVDELNEFATYLATTVDWLNQQPAASFTPDLMTLDALVQSILVK